MFNRIRHQGKSDPTPGAVSAFAAKNATTAPPDGRPTVAKPHRLPSIEHLSDAERERLKALPLTARWMPPGVQKVLLALPETVVPRETCAKHPLIVERLLGAWRDPRAFRAALQGITMDDRSQRQGFPFQVVNELGLLGDYYDRFVFPEKRGAWTNVDPY